tara:strand:- start:66119 stop:66682 length:564 start_codon:yes stop_codon:yes gene_type:complete
MNNYYEGFEELLRQRKFVLDLFTQNDLKTIKNLLKSEFIEFKDPMTSKLVEMICSQGGINFSIMNEFFNFSINLGRMTGLSSMLLKFIGENLANDSVYFVVNRKETGRSLKEFAKDSKLILTENQLNKINFLTPYTRFKEMYFGLPNHVRYLFIDNSVQRKDSEKFVKEFKNCFHEHFFIVDGSYNG